MKSSCRKCTSKHGVFWNQTRRFVPLALAICGWIIVGLKAGGQESTVDPFEAQPETMPWDEPDSNLVGNTGELDRIDFIGNTTFTAGQLRDALAATPGFLLNSHQCARRSDFLAVLREKIHLGYLAAGFPEAQVSAGYNTAGDRVQVNVVEGRRFRCGQVRVAGLSAELEKAVVERLTRRSETKPGGNVIVPPQESSSAKTTSTSSKDAAVNVSASLTLTPDKKDSPLNPAYEPNGNLALWLPGQPADFSEAALTDFRQEVLDVLMEQGRLFPKFDVRPEWRSKNGTAELIVKVADLGPAGKVSKVEIRGNRKNSEAEIRKFLDLKPGMPVTRAKLLAAERKAWDSGRFKLCEVSCEPDTNSVERVGVVVNVNEFDFAPKLTETLSAKQKAFLKLCAWLNAFSTRRGVDAVCSYEGQSGATNTACKFIISPDQGAVMNFKMQGLYGMDFDYSVLLTSNSLGVFAPQRGIKLFSEEIGADTAVQVSVRVVPERPEATNDFDMQFAGGAASRTNANGLVKPPFELQVKLSPALFLKLAAKWDDQIKLDRNRCSLSDSNIQMQFDAVTGQIERLHWKSPGETGSLVFVPNAFDDAVRELKTTTAAFTNYYSPGHGISSLVGFMSTELLQVVCSGELSTNLTASDRQLLGNGLWRLFGSGVLAPLDEMAGQNETNQTEKYSIPSNGSDSNLMLALAGYGFKYCNQWFPKYSWPWTLAHESVLLIGGQTDYTEAELNRLMKSSSTGPIGCLAISAALAQIHSPAAKAVAAQGLTRLTREDFRTDYRLFLSGDSAFSHAFANMADTLRAMPPEEVAAIARPLPAPEAQLLKESAEALRARPKEPLATALGTPLNHYWDQRLRRELRDLLQKIASSEHG